MVVVAATALRTYLYNVTGPHAVGFVTVKKCCDKISLIFPVDRCQQFSKQLYQCLRENTKGFDLVQLFRDTQSLIPDNVKNMCMEQEGGGPMLRRSQHTSSRLRDQYVPYLVTRAPNAQIAQSSRPWISTTMDEPTRDVETRDRKIGREGTDMQLNPY